MTTTPGSPDGRRTRGAASRRALIDATLLVIERDGMAGVSHRTVTREAGLGPTAVTYHFGSIDHLLLSAVQAGTSRWVEGLADRFTGSFLDDLVALLLHEAEHHRDRLIADNELYVHAARRPALREAAGAWPEALIAPLGPLDEVQRRTLIAAIDGLSIQMVHADGPLDEAVVRAVLAQAMPERRPAGPSAPDTATPTSTRASSDETATTPP